MSLLSENLGIYFGATYNYPEILSTFRNSFSLVYDVVKNNETINIDFKKTFSDYPKYPDNFVYVSSLTNFNIQKIRECTLDSVDVLIDSIDDDVLTLKYILDRIPTSRDDLIYDINLQNTYFKTIQDLYDPNMLFLNYFNIQQYQNEFNKSLSIPINNVVSQHNYLQQFMFIFGLVQTLPKLMNFRRQYSDYVISRQVISEQTSIDSFTDHIDNSMSDIADHLSEICLRHVYSMVEVSDSLKQLSVNSISKTSDELKQQFESFLQVLPIDPILEIPKLHHNALTHAMAIELSSDIFDNETIINNNVVIGLQNNLDSILEKYLSVVDEYNIKSHSYLLYLYKFYPIKFINILSIIIRDYTESIVIPSSENYLTSNEISTALYDFCYNKIDFTKLSIYLENNLTNETVQQISDKYQVYDFTIILYYLRIMEYFLESKNFQEYIQYVLKTLFDDLFDAGYIDRSFNYRRGYELVHLYFVAHFKNAISSKLLFGDMCDAFKTSIDSCLTNNFDLIIDEVPTGAFDGMNTTFLTAYQFDSNSLEVYIDDVLVDSSQYNISEIYHNVTFLVPPTGTKITTTYIPKYNISYTTDSYLLERYFKDLTQSRSMVQNILQFTQNMCLTTINKQIFLNILNYFQV